MKQIFMNKMNTFFRCTDIFCYGYMLDEINIHCIKMYVKSDQINYTNDKWELIEMT